MNLNNSMANLQAMFAMELFDSTEGYLDAIRMDLENLLNTRQPIIMSELRRLQLDNTLVGYGIPDLAQYDPSSTEDQKLINQAIANAISYYEPRLRSVVVKVLKKLAKEAATVQIEIQAMLKISGMSHAIAFISDFNPVNGCFYVENCYA